MSPNLATNDLAHKNLGYAKGVAKGGLGLTSSVTTTNLHDRRIGELGIAVPGAARALIGAYARSPLCVPVGVVVGHGAKPKVIWANTWGVVAMMANACVRRNRPVVQFPRVTMGAVGAATGDGNLAVPVLVLPSNPKPAVAGLVHLRPKPFFNWCAGILSEHLELILRGVMRATVTAVRPLSIVLRPLSSDGALTLGAGMTAI